MSTLLLDEFRSLFEGTEYRHRNSTLGDHVAQFLYEDMYHLALSPAFNQSVDRGEGVLSSTNRTHGVKHRRGDGSFGTRIPGEVELKDHGFKVSRGPLATILVGAEVKIICKAMVRQAGRVISDLRGQADEFKRSNSSVVTVGLVGVNHAELYRSVEGTREYPTTGKGRFLHPIQEAEKTALKIRHELEPALDELLIFRFRASNLPPFPFEWLNASEVKRDYSSALVRIASAYDRRFGLRI